MIAQINIVADLNKALGVGKKKFSALGFRP